MKRAVLEPKERGGVRPVTHLAIVVQVFGSLVRNGAARHHSGVTRRSFGPKGVARPDSG